MASTTKIMTCIVILENANLNDVVVVDKKAAATGGSRLGLKTGDKITVNDLLYGLMLVSGNDAAVALAIHVGGSVEGFATLMNQKANELGLKNTNFVTPHGLDSEKHYTTAYELAKIADYALQKEKFKKIVGTQSCNITINGKSKKIQNVFLNSLMKYSTDNPFRKNSNSNVPLLLLLKVIGLLKNDEEENGAGVFRQELSLFICWKDDDANRLYKKIKEIRKNVKFTYSDEYIYDICLEELGCITDEEKQNSKKYYKMSKICGEAVDEYIRKMRSTGLLSLRGNGRFLDYNSFEQKKIDYVLKNYSEYIKFENRESYYKYIGEIDNNILVIEEEDNIPKKDEVKLDTLRRLAKEYSKDFIFNELMLVSGKKESSDKLLKFISGPIRLEFLTSIALVQNFNDIMVLPSYPVDDEGLPTMTAGGDTPDIVCYDGEYDSLFEVTLMCGRSDQVNNEIIPIRRHLLERIKKNNNSFSVFVAPIIHEDTKEAIEWYKHKDNVDIIPYTILEMIEEFKIKNNLGELLN